MAARVHLEISGMTCANCASTIERVLGKKLPGVEEARVNLATEQADVVYDPERVSEKDIIAAIARAGYGAAPAVDSDAHAAKQQDAVKKQRIKLIVGVVFTLPLFILSMGRDFGLLGHEWHRPEVNLLFWILATPVQFYVGLDYYINGFKSLRNRMANMDVLIALGSSVAYFYSAYVVLLSTGGHAYFETSAMIITLIKAGKFLEAKAKKNTQEAIKGLLKLQAKTAWVKRGEEFVSVPVDQVAKGDILRVRPGEKVPVDGVIDIGEASFDEQFITGESVPVLKRAGQEVIGSSLMVDGAILVRATKVGKETMLAQVVRMVEAAQGSRAEIQSLADRVSSYFVPIVIVLAILTFAFWRFIGGDGGDATLRLIAVLIIACPCALGLATPAAIVVGMGRGARHGVLFKDSRALESLCQVNSIVFDKTGTVTEGRPIVESVQIMRSGADRKSILSLARSLEHLSEHPLAQAIEKYASQEGGAMLPVQNFRVFPGGGVKGEIEGQVVVMGSLKFLAEQGVSFAGEGGSGETPSTIVVLAKGSEPLALFALSDPIKDTANQALANLRSQGIDLRMVTGDNEKVAFHVGSQLGLQNVVGGAKPQDKAHIIEELKRDGKTVAMVGDGINDAPALAAADVGIAMASGTDIAIESSDLTLIRGDLSKIAFAIGLSRKTLRVIKQNLFWAFFYNAVLIPLAAGAFAGIPGLPSVLFHLHPIVAALAMAFSSLSVLGNSLRLRSVPVGVS
jgi:Cu+-exporting ATPase